MFLNVSTWATLLGLGLLVACSDTPSSEEGFKQVFKAEIPLEGVMTYSLE